ncbi:MAG: bifunctional DNA primase/polymerase, partial [Planctomycetota bacterium]|nr:bifunctional DNA primase/polymerase [Planctomycetota bacterium]
MTLLDCALAYLHAGLCVLPARVATKHPALPEWKSYRRALPTEAQVRMWFGNAEALCLLTGRASGQLEVLDFDCAGDCVAAWSQLIQEYAPDLWAKLTVVRTPSGGCHVLYQSHSSVPGSTKLASRDTETPNGDEVTLYGKRYKPRWNNGRWIVTLTLIETKGEGGLVLSAPSPGYTLERGSIENLPILTDAEREVLVSAARSLNEVPPAPEPVRLSPAENQGRPGDDFNQRGDIREVLLKHGWTLA